MLTKKEKILVQPFIEQSYNKHRRKVQSAQPVIDFTSPTEHPHVLIKLKKIQKERERMQEIERENQRLLQKLSHIMSTSRVENYWKEPHPTFLNRICANAQPDGRRAKSVSSQTMNVSSTQSQANGRICERCSRRATIPPVKIPEERIPFEPPRKSWNIKIRNDRSNAHCCGFCC